jgi:hypothetical protein
MIYELTFTLAHWIFANKYWLLSRKLPPMINDSFEQPNLNCINIFNLLMFTNIIVWPVLTMILFLGIHLYSWDYQNS